MQPRIERAREDVDEQAERRRLRVEELGELIAVSRAPRFRIQPNEKGHALASLRWPTRATACNAPSRARSACSPAPVMRYGLRRSSLASASISPCASRRAIAPYRVP